MGLGQESKNFRERKRKDSTMVGEEIMEVLAFIFISNDAWMWWLAGIFGFNLWLWTKK